MASFSYAPNYLMTYIKERRSDVGLSDKQERNARRHRQYDTKTDRWRQHSQNKG
jgi:hypothetical protein